MNYSDLSTEQQMIAETKKYVNNKALDVQSDWNESDSSAGDYIKNKPTLGTAAVLDVASSGNASSSQVVKGDDSRLTDSRNAADVYSWAKAPTKPAYTASEVGAYTKTESDNKYVAKETGKGLSTNDYTTADKNKLTGIEAQANKTVVDSSMSDSSTNPLQNKVITKELEGTKTTSGNPLTIEDAAPVNAVNLSIDLEPIQAGSGIPSPDNIRPISGRSEVAIQRVGKNLFDKDTATDGYRFGSDGMPFAQSGYSVSDYIRVDKSTAYVRDKNMNTNECACLYDSNKGFIDRITTGKTFQTTSATCYVRLSMLTTDKDTTQFEKGSAATEYKPYAGKTYTIQLGDTVYGGTLDVTRGKMVVDRGYKTIADFEWMAEGSGSFSSGDIGAKRFSSTQLSTIISSHCPTVPQSPDPTQFSISGLHWVDGFQLWNTGCTNFNELKEQYGELQVCYELATPYTIQLTPQQIKLLENNNTISTDYNGDTITLEYQPNNAIGEAVRVVEENYETRVSLLESRNTAKVYGFHISSTESDPAAKVTYLADAVGMTPARMNFSTGTFDYGSWENVWFVRDTKPCLLKDIGQIHRYLNKNNFLKDIDGNDTGVPQITIHTMIEFPKIWYKVVPDIDGKGASIYISPVKVDADYVDYPYIDYQGIHKEHFYMPAYNGSTQTESGTTYLCSTYGETVSKSLTAEQEIAYCKAHGNGWNTEDAGSIMLINFLLILMGKSTDVQSVFGQGLHTSGTEAINNGFTTGIHYNKGMFYGTNSGTIASNNYSNAVKVFGMENYWGFQWRRYAGDILVNGIRKIKLCYGNEDGSSTFDYNLTGNGYVNVGATPSGTSSGYISEMKFTKTGMYSKVSSGSSSTYYCDGQWFNNSDTRYALRGGSSRSGARCGAFYVSLDNTASDAGWDGGVGLEYK